ncbi:MAG: hypothetical protein ACXQTW_06140 [Candidatus Methanospirareceae archaeon]
MDLTEIEEKLNTLGEMGELTPVEAMSRANEIVKAINKVIEVQVEEEDYETLAKLYEKAASAYLLAAEKVSRESRDRVAFPANYWLMRARQVRLMQRKPSAHISKPLRFVRIGTITPSLKSEVDISKPYEIGLQYPKRKDIEKFVEKPESTKVEFYECGDLEQSKKIDNELKVEPTEIELKDVALYAVRSAPHEVKSNIKPALEDVSMSNKIFKEDLSIDTIGGQYHE